MEVTYFVILEHVTKLQYLGGGCYWHTKQYIDQWNRMESLKTTTFLVNSLYQG